MSSRYDPCALQKRAQLWRIEAEAVTLQALREFCLEEAQNCERRAILSTATPVLRQV
jgi:hypothetical protein